MDGQLIGKRIAQRYLVRSLIGRGGIGSVFRATDTRSDSDVALKLLRSEYTSDPKTRRRFNKEARAFAYLRHPNIVAVHDFGQDEDGTLYLAMELVDGASLRAVMERPLPLHVITKCVEQLLDALAHAHARGVIHRDLKPENVLIAQPEPGGPPLVKLVDFGLASLPTVATAGATQHTGTVIGTPSYMAPEQARGSKGVVGPGTDIYAVGVILFELLCGRLPFEAESSIELILKHVQQPIPPLHPRPGLSIPEPLEEIVRRAMAKKPWDRFVNAADFRRALHAVEVAAEPIPRLVPEAVGGNTTSSQPLVHPTPNRLDREDQTPTPASGVHAIPTADTSRLESGVRWPASEVKPVVQAPTPPAGVQSISSAVFSMSSGQIVGRDAELARLQEICERGLSGQGQVIIIEGESGIGKSSVTRTVLHRFTETGLMRAAVGLYTSTEGGGVNVGLRAALESIFGTTDMDRTAMRTQARGVLDRLGIHDEHDKTELLDFLRPTGAGRTDAVGEVAEVAVRRQRSRLALVQRLVRLIAQEMPLLLLLEDLHWAGDGIAGFLESMAASFRLHSTPCVLLCTYTREELPEGSEIDSSLSALSRFEGTCVHRVGLARLTHEQTLGLITNTIPLESELANHLATRAGGNPFYALHFLQSLRQDGRLEKHPDKDYWRLRQDVAVESALPTSVADVVRRRIARTRGKLGERAEAYYDVLVRAAVLGMTIEDQLIEAMLTAEGDQAMLDVFDDALDVWVDSGVLRESSDRQADVLKFDHVLIREVILDDIPTRKLRRLHKLAAMSKRDFYYPYIQGVAHDIAEHFELAGDHEQAAEYRLLAARAAEGSGNFAEASRQFTKLLEIFEQQQQSLVDDPTSSPSAMHATKSGLLRITIDWSEVWLGLGRIAVAQGYYDKATEYVEQLVRYAEQRGFLLPQAKAHWLLGRIATRRGRLVEAWDYFGTARDLFEAESDMLGVAQCLWGTGQVAQLSGWLNEAREWLDEARGIYEKAERPIDVATCLVALGATALSGGLLKEAREHFEHARATFEGAQDRYNVNYCILGIARVDVVRGFVRDAMDLFQQAIQAFAELGDRHGQIDSLNGMGTCYLYLGESDTAQKFLSEALTGYKQLEDRHGQGHNLRYQAVRLRWRGAGTEAIQFLSKALDHLTAAGDRQGEAACYLELARLAIDLEDDERAESHFNQAHELYFLSSDATGIAACAEVWACVCAMRGKFEDALPAALEGLEVARKTGALPLVAKLLASALRAAASAGNYAEVRRLVAEFDQLDTPLDAIGDPVFERSLRGAAEALQRPGVDPDLRGLRGRFVGLADRLANKFRPA